jgi:hypothetical protein
MPLKFLRDEIGDAESAAEAQQLHRDFNWFCEHSAELSEQFSGMYVAVAGEEVYAAATREEAYNLAKEQKPGSQPLVFHIPAERRIMIYDLQREVYDSER